MIVSTSDLIGKSLLWGLALVEQWEPWVKTIELKDRPPVYIVATRTREVTEPISWAMLGPISERERITSMAPTVFKLPGGDLTVDYWRAMKECQQGMVHGAGPTELIAKTRCWIRCNLGDTIDVPDQLINK